MNVALLHYAAPPVVGGVESVLGHHACLLAEAGHHVRVIAGRGGPFDPGVEFISLPLVDSRHPDIAAAKAELDAGRVPDNFPALVQALCQALGPPLAGVDLLIAHNVCSLHKNLALTAAVRQIARLPGAPRLILWHHDLAWTTPRYRAELHDGYPWDLLRSNWTEALQVVVSDLRRRELAELIRIVPEDIVVIPNGVDLDVFYKLEPETRALVTHMRLLDAAPILLLPVRITPRKNIELALRAMAQLRRVLPDAALVVTGPLGPHNPANTTYFERLKALRTELGLLGAVHFLVELARGYLPDAVIADFFRLADALFLPSREEGFGIPVLEAGLSGLPIFCADIPPLRELGNSQASFFSPDADPDEVAELIAGRLTMDDLYKFRVRIRQAYTWERVYARHIAPLLESIG